MRCERDLAMVERRPKRLLKMRSRICAVSISGGFYHAGKRVFGKPAPVHLTRHLLFAVIPPIASRRIALAISTTQPGRFSIGRWQTKPPDNVSSSGQLRPEAD